MIWLYIASIRLLGQAAPLAVCCPCKQNLGSSLDPALGSLRARRPEEAFVCVCSSGGTCMYSGIQYVHTYTATEECSASLYQGLLRKQFPPLDWNPEQHRRWQFSLLR